MSARPDASASPATKSPPQDSRSGALSPRAAELGGLAAMRQTLNDISLDSLSSLLDDELSLDPPATAGAPAPQAGPPAPPVASSGAPEVEAPSAPMPTQIVATQPAATLPVAIPSPNASAATQAQLPAAARRSSLDETQLYKSTPQPTIDLASVRRSASEPTQAFDGNLEALKEVSATLPAAVDPSKSSSFETTLWTPQDRDSALTAEPVEPSPAVAHPASEPTSCLPAPDLTQALSADAATDSSPTCDAATPPNAPEAAPSDSPAVTTPKTIAQQLAGFFAGEPRRTTDIRWEEAVESDRQFTTMLLSELDEPLLPAAAPEERASIPFAASASAAPDAAAYDSPAVVDPLSVPAPAPPAEADDVGNVASAPPAAPANGPVALAESPALAGSVAAFRPDRAASGATSRHASFPEPSPEVRQLATRLLERSTPGVSTAVAVAACEETCAGARATLALAAALADATGVSTLVVDADFARRDLSRAANAEEASGFAEALSQPATGRSFAQCAGRDNLQLLPAGVAPPDAAEAPARVSAWIARAKHEHGLILIWLGSSGDEFQRRLCGAADLSLLLAAVDRDRPSTIEAAAERLRSVNARTLGVALVQA